MAFWAVYGKPWFKKPFPNMIYLYKKKLYDDWFNSLSEEDKQKHLDYLERKKKKREEDFRRLMSIPKILIDSLERRGYRSEYF